MSEEYRAEHEGNSLELLIAEVNSKLPKLPSAPVITTAQIKAYVIVRRELHEELHRKLRMCLSPSPPRLPVSIDPAELALTDEMLTAEPE